ncbi:hypothetical protein Dimus_004035 [Dionaea muscipula]
MPLQEVRPEGVKTSQALEQVRPASPQGRILRSASPPPHRKKPSPPPSAAEGNMGVPWRRVAEMMRLLTLPWGEGKRVMMLLLSQRRLVRGKGKDVTVAMAVDPMVESQDKPGAGRESKKI